MSAAAPSFMFIFLRLARKEVVVGLISYPRQSVGDITVRTNHFDVIGFFPFHPLRPPHGKCHWMYGSKCSTTHPSGFRCSSCQNIGLTFLASGWTWTNSGFTAHLDSLTFDLIVSHPSSFFPVDQSITFWSAYNFSRQDGSMWEVQMQEVKEVGYGNSLVESLEATSKP